MEIMLGIVLAGAAGWNAFLPLLELGFAHRLSGRIPVGTPYTFISSVGGFVVLLVLLPVELFLDKAPHWDARNDRFGAIYRPAAGALIMLATTKDTALPGIAAAIIGAAIAFGMHCLKTRYRRPLTDVLAGMATPIASFCEDLVVVLVSFIALLKPVIGIVLLVLAAVLMWWLCGSVQRRVPPKPSESTATPAAQP